MKNIIIYLDELLPEYFCQREGSRIFIIIIRNMTPGPKETRKYITNPWTFTKKDLKLRDKNMIRSLRQCRLHLAAVGDEPLEATRLLWQYGSRPYIAPNRRNTTSLLA